AQILRGDLREPSEECDRVPFRPLLLLARGLVLPALGRGDADVGHRAAAREIPGLRICAEVADQDYFVDAPHALRAAMDSSLQTRTPGICVSPFSARTTPPIFFSSTVLY